MPRGTFGLTWPKAQRRLILKLRLVSSSGGQLVTREYNAIIQLLPVILTFIIVTPAPSIVNHRAQSSEAAQSQNMASATTSSALVLSTALPVHIGGHSVPLGGIKIVRVRNQAISTLLPYGAIVLVSMLVGIVLISIASERWILRLVYPRTYGNLEKNKEMDRQRRSFVFHHIALLLMIPILFVGLEPGAAFLFGNSDLSDIAFNGDHAMRHGTVGDVLFVLFHLYSAYFLFEMAFRTRFASAINVAHHLALLLITQIALVLSLDLQKHPEATIEFYMCLVWGAFDIVAEIPMHTIMIVWRIHRDTKPALLSRLGFGLSAWVCAMACAEVAVTVFLLQRSWDRWSTEWRIATPIIFTMWICAQLHGARIFFTMAMKERRKLKRVEPSPVSP